MGLTPCNPGTQEGEAGGLCALEGSVVYTEFQDRHDYAEKPYGGGT